MTRETLEDLNRNTLIGFTDMRDHAWHYRAGLQGGEPNHYPGAIPVADVKRRLFDWDAETVPAGRYLPARFNRTGGRPMWTETRGRVSIIHGDTGEELGTAASGYRIHQYRTWLLDSVESILDSELAVGSAGVLKGGRVAFVSVEVPDNIVTPEGVVFRPHLLAVTSLDKSLETTYKRVITLVVCDNTLTAARSESGEEERIKHTKHSGLKLAKVRDKLSIVYETGDEFAAEVKRLTDTKVTDAQWHRFLEVSGLTPPAPVKIVLPNGRTRVKNATAITRAEKRMSTLDDLWTKDPRVSPWTNSAYGVLAALNTYGQHVSGVRGMARDERNMLNVLTGKVEKEDNATLSRLEAVLTG